MNINERIRKYMKDNRYTQTMISKKTGMSVKAIGTALKNKRRFTAEELIDFCEAVDESVDFIVHYGDEIKEESEG